MHTFRSVAQIKWSRHKDINQLLVTFRPTKNCVKTRGEESYKQISCWMLLYFRVNIERIKKKIHKYTTVYTELNWKASSLRFKKMNQRLFLYRKLRSFNIDMKIVSLIYKSCIESVLCFCICGFGGTGVIKIKTNLIFSCDNHSPKLCTLNPIGIKSIKFKVLPV